LLHPRLENLLDDHGQSVNRSQPAAVPTVALTQMEMELLDQLMEDKAGKTFAKKNLTHYLTKIARLGGYLARRNDPVLGNIVMWRGLSRLTDIALGFSIRGKCGNLKLGRTLLIFVVDMSSCMRPTDGRTLIGLQHR
jgi:hypothetical protein